MTSRPMLLCLLPAERAHLSESVQAAGGTPVIDLTLGELPSVPAGAWVRVLPWQEVPGDGPVLLAVPGSPVAGRPTWIERTSAGPAPEGFAGVLLRGSEAPGLCGDRPGLDMLANMPHETPVILEAGLSPVEAGRAVAAGVAGVVLSDVLMGLPELALPPKLAALLAEAWPEGGRRIHGARVLCDATAPALRRLAAGAALWQECRGWLVADDPSERPWPAGTGVVIARSLAAQHGSLPGLIAAYREAARVATVDAVRPVVEAVMPSLRDLVTAIAATLARPADPLPASQPVAAASAPVESVPAMAGALCVGVAVGLPGGEAVFAEDNLLTLGTATDRLQPAQPGGRRGPRPARLGRPAAFDLSAEFGVDAGLADGLDPVTRLAVAAGLEAVADAGLPLVADPALPGGRGLAPSLRAGTGVIFASALPGLVRLLLSNGEATASALVEGQAVLAELLGASGPSVAVNAGRASVATALAIALDWISLGRADRVIVIGADDPADEVLLEVLGEGLAPGADALSVGASGFVLERDDLAIARGRGGRARLVEARVGQSARQGAAGEAGVWLVKPSGVELRSTVPTLGDALGAGLDDVLAVMSLSGPGGASVGRATRLAAGTGSASALLVWEQGEPQDAQAAARWQAEMVGGATRLPARVGPPRPAPAPEPLAELEPEPEPAQRVEAEPAPSSEPDPVAVAAVDHLAEPEPEAELSLELELAPEPAQEPEPALAPDPLPALTSPLPPVLPDPLPELAFDLAPDDLPPAPTVPVPAPPLAPRADAPRALPPADEDEPDSSGKGSGKLAAWTRRLRRKGKKPSSEASRSGDVLGQARERVMTDLLLLVSRRDEEATLPSPQARLSTELELSEEDQLGILESLGAHYELDLDAEAMLADDPTLEALAEKIVEEARAVWQESPEVPPGLRRLFAIEESVERPAAQPILVRAVGAVAPPVPLTAEAARAPDRAMSLVIELVAAEAGYRPEELRTDLELEGDLGLDNSARVRIVGALCARFGAAIPDLEEPVTVESLGRWAAEVASLDATLPMVAAGGAGPVQILTAPAVSPTESAAEEVAHQLKVSVENAEREPPVAPSRVPRAREELPPSFRARRVVRVSQALTALGSVKGRVVQVLGSGPLPDALRRELQVRGALLEGQPDAVMDAGDDPSLSYSTAFALAASPPRDWLCITRLGLGGSDPARALRAGGRAGVAKSLRREWSGCRARCLDLSPSLDLAEMVLLTMDELAGGDDALEVWRDDGPRQVMALRVEETPPPAAWPVARPTVLIVGGTRGIGFRIGLALARRTRARLILMARTPPSKKPYDEAASRAAVERALRARGRRPSETRILRGLEPYRMAEEARCNLAKLRDAGAEVHFVRADVGDRATIEGALDEVLKAFGAVDGAVIALPIGEAHALSSRDPAHFASAWSPRVVGVSAISDKLGADGWLLSVGGLAGRFGQAGRVEVGAALQALGSFCELRPRALHVTCPAWTDGGRSDEGPGADPLPVEAGVDLMLDLIAAGATGERVLSGRLGQGVLIPSHALLDALDVEGAAIHAARRLSPDDDPWLADHSLDGTPFVPASVLVELMAAAGRAAAPGLPFSGLAGLRLERPLNVPFGTELRVQIRAEQVEPERVQAVLYVEHHAAADLVEQIRYADAVLLFGPQPAPSLLPSAIFPEESIPRSQIYRRLFQGSTFQVLRDAGAVAAEGLLADAVVEHAMLGDDLVSAPLVLEAAIQGVTLHHMAIDGLRALPLSLDGLWLEQSPPDGEPLELMVQRLDDAYDIDVFGPEGAILRVRGLRLVDVATLTESERFAVPEGGWPSVMVGLTLS